MSLNTPEQCAIASIVESLCNHYNGDVGQAIGSSVVRGLELDGLLTYDDIGGQTEYPHDIYLPYTNLSTRGIFVTFTFDEQED